MMLYLKAPREDEGKVVEYRHFVDLEQGGLTVIDVYVAQQNT